MGCMTEKISRRTAQQCLAAVAALGPDLNMTAYSLPRLAGAHGRRRRGLSDTGPKLLDKAAQTERYPR